MSEELLMLGRLLLSLVVVLALAVVLLRFGLPRLAGLKSGRQAQLETLEVRPLDRQHKLAVVRLRDQHLLLGLGGGGVTLLQTWQEEGATQESQQPAAESSAARDPEREPRAVQIGEEPA